VSRSGLLCFVSLGLLCFSLKKLRVSFGAISASLALHPAAVGTRKALPLLARGVVSCAATTASPAGSSSPHTATKLLGHLVDCPAQIVSSILGFRLESFDFSFHSRDLLVLARLIKLLGLLGEAAFGVQLGVENRQSLRLIDGRS